MNEAGAPLDFIWRNLGGTRGVYFFRKWVFNLLGLLVVLFLSTPTAIFSSLQLMEVFDMEKIDQESFWGRFIIVAFPAFIIIIINYALLYFIYYSAYWEKRGTHSKYQSSIFNKSLVYLLLNMLIIPGITLTN